MIFIGIDPGQSGGIAFLCTPHHQPSATNAWKMPETECDIWGMMRARASDTFAVIEAVHSMPKQGVVSSFKFGMSYGGLRMALIAAGISFEAVPPQKWQKAMGCLTKGDKNVSKRRAQELFPRLKVTHATADALLLASYAQRIYNERTRNDIQTT